MAKYAYLVSYQHPVPSLFKWPHPLLKPDQDVVVLEKPLTPETCVAVLQAGVTRARAVRGVGSNPVLNPDDICGIQFSEISVRP